MEAILNSASLPSFDPDEWIVIFFLLLLEVGNYNRMK